MSSRSWAAFLMFLLGLVLAFWEGAKGVTEIDRKNSSAYWLFLGVLTVGSLLLLLLFVYLDQKHLSKSKDKQLTAEGFAAVTGVSLLVRAIAGWDSMSLSQKRLFFGAGWLVVVAVVVYVGFRVYKSLAGRSQSTPQEPLQRPSSSALLSVIGIGSSLIFTFAVKEVFEAHNALTRLRAFDVLRGRVVLDSQTVFQAQNHSSDRMFWALIALGALGAAITCYLLKQKK